jgi:diacylglycerol kinase family enzyme
MSDYSRTENISQSVQEFNDFCIEGNFGRGLSALWLERDRDHEIPVNLDGEPYSAKRIGFLLEPGAIKVVMPSYCLWVS